MATIHVIANCICAASHRPAHLERSFFQAGTLWSLATPYREHPMLNHELRHDDEILVLNPEGPLAVGEFTTVANQVDTYLEQHRTLRGVLIRAKSFPGWENFDALLTHLKFL